MNHRTTDSTDATDSRAPPEIRTTSIPCRKLLGGCRWFHGWFPKTPILNQNDLPMKLVYLWFVLPMIWGNFFKKWNWSPKWFSIDHLRIGLPMIWGIPHLKKHLYQWDLVHNPLLYYKLLKSTVSNRWVFQTTWPACRWSSQLKHAETLSFGKRKTGATPQHQQVCFRQSDSYGLRSSWKKNVVSEDRWISQSTLSSLSRHNLIVSLLPSLSLELELSGASASLPNSEVAKLPISAVLKYWLILQLIDLRIPCYSFLFWFLHFEKGKWEVYDFATLYFSHELKIRRSTSHLFARFLRRRASYQPNALKPEQGGTMTALTVKRVDPPAALAPQCWTSWGSGSTSAEIRGLKAGRRSWVE